MLDPSYSLLSSQLLKAPKYELFSKQSKNKSGNKTRTFINPEISNLWEFSLPSHLTISVSKDEKQKYYRL